MFWLVILIAGAGCFYFIDGLFQWVSENLLSAIGLGAIGGGAAETARRKSEKAAQESEIYDDMRVKIDEDVVNGLIEADRQAKEAEKIADEITQPKDSPLAGAVRKRWDIK